MALAHAYSSLPIALVAGFMYVRVLLVIPMQRAFLGKGAERRVWIAAGIGIADALVALWPRLVVIGTPHWNWGVLSLIVAAIAGAGSQICMRRLGKTNPASVVVAVSAVLISAIIAVPAAATAIEPPAADLPWLIGMGLLSAVAQWSTVRSYQHAAPAVLMPVTLIDIPVALIVGYTIFGEVPNFYAAAGAFVVVVSSLYIGTRRS